MDTYKVKWTRMQSEIFRLLCIRAGQSLNLRTIARLLKKSPTAVSNALKDLKKENIIKIQKIENINLLLIELNRENLFVLNMKRIENLKLLYEVGLINFLQNNFPGATIILFGSYSRGEDVYMKDLEQKKSDIDIAIIGVSNPNLDLIEFNKKLEREIAINFYPSFKMIHKHLRDNILNGILLSGGIDL